MNIKDKVMNIDRVIRQYPWLDFEVAEYKNGKLTIVGSVDTSDEHVVEIDFVGVAFASLPMCWRTDTTNVVISVVEGGSAVVINQTFRVEQGSSLFQFVPEDYPQAFRCLVGARDVACRVMREPDSAKKA